jgi:hypothetical protein
VTHTFRICPTNAVVIEWKADLPGARWCFFKTNDSKRDAKRSLSAINGETVEDTEQMELMGETA